MMQLKPEPQGQTNLTHQGIHGLAEPYHFDQQQDSCHQDTQHLKCLGEDPQGDPQEVVEVDFQEEEAVDSPEDQEVLIYQERLKEDNILVTNLWGTPYSYITATLPEQKNS